MLLVPLSWRTQADLQFPHWVSQWGSLRPPHTSQEIQNPHLQIFNGRFPDFQWHLHGTWCYCMPWVQIMLGMPPSVLSHVAGTVAAGRNGKQLKWSPDLFCQLVLRRKQCKSSGTGLSSPLCTFFHGWFVEQMLWMCLRCLFLIYFQATSYTTIAGIALAWQLMLQVAKSRPRGSFPFMICTEGKVSSN